MCQAGPRDESTELAEPVYSSVRVQRSPPPALTVTCQCQSLQSQHGGEGGGTHGEGRAKEAFSSLLVRPATSVMCVCVCLNKNKLQIRISDNPTPGLPRHAFQPPSSCMLCPRQATPSEQHASCPSGSRGSKSALS